MDMQLAITRLRFKGQRDQFWRDAAAMLRANRSILAWLRSLHLAAPKSAQGAAAGFVAQEMARTPDFAKAIGPLLPPMDRLMVHAAEVAKEKPRIYELLAEQIETVRRLRNLLLAALTLPLIALSACSLTIFLYGSKVYPEFVKVIPIGRWPSDKQLVANVAMFLAGPGGLVVVALLLAFSAWLVVSFERLTGPVRSFLDDHVPPYTLVRAVRGVEVTMALATLLEAKQGWRSILERMQHLGSPWLAWHAMQIQQLSRSTRASEPLEALDTGLLSPALFFRLRQYSAVAGAELSSLMLHAARDESARLERRLAVIAQILGLAVYVVAAATFVLLWTSMPQISPTQAQ
jgi:type II secretory pathway component PulF